MKNKNDLTIIIVIVALFILFFSGFGMMGFGGLGGMMGMFNYGFSGMWMFGWLFMTLIIIALVLFIVWIAKQLQENKK